mgnify:CR=1 FL=1
MLLMTGAGSVNKKVASSGNTFSGSFVAASTQYAKVENNLGIDGGNITIEMWIYPTTLPTSGGNNQLGFIQQSSATSNVSFQIIYFTSDDVNYYLRVVRTKHGVGSETADYLIGNVLNTWTHVVMTYDGTNLKSYTSSAGAHTERATIAASGSGNAGQAWNGLTVAGWSGADQSTYSAPSQTMGGQEDDIRVWNTVRTTTEMDDNDTVQLVGNETGLVAYYKLNNAWTDSTANAFNLTDVNSPTFSSNVPF